MDRLTIPDEKTEGGTRCHLINARVVRDEAMAFYWALKKYEDTGLTPEEIIDGKILTGWIPVSERLPKYETDVLICWINKCTAVGTFWETGVITTADNDHVRINSGLVTAWMPLPEPWKGE